MNSYLNDIFAQPRELEKVYRHLTNKETSVLHEIASMMSISGEIVLTSMGSAYYSLMPMYYELKKRGKNVHLTESAEILFTPGSIRKTALYIIMSRSGESGEISALAQKLREAHCVSVCITMTPDSTLARNSTLVLYDPSEYDALICTKAYTTLALSGLLCVSYMDNERLLSEDEHAFFDMLNWMEERKQRILDALSALSYLSAPMSYYYLSRGYGMGVIQSASLWLEETAKVPGNVLSLDNYYHGPIELSRTSILPVFLDVNPDTRSIGIWTKICTYAANSIYLAPEGARDIGRFTLHYPRYALDDGYHMIMHALFFQLLAYQNAVVRGIEPGTMDTLTWVVK